MKFVSLIMIGMMMSFGAAAQGSSNTAEKKLVQKQQKKKAKKSKLASTKLPASKNVDVVTLKDEKAYTAKWSFDEMLKRRLEIDAADSEKERQRLQRVE